MNIKLKKVFQLKLGKEYYNKGIIQVPKEFEQFVPKEKGVNVKLSIENELTIYPTLTLSKENRKINGKTELKEWFQKHFQLNELVNVEIVSETEFIVFL